jgi:hypothetical protein
MGCGSGVRGNSRHYPASCLPLRSEYFFGVEWLRDHVRTGGRYSGYLTMNPVVQNDGMGIDQNNTLKVLELAELLYNLQGVPGLDHCLDRMFSGEIRPRWPNWILVCSSGDKVLRSCTSIFGTRC